MGDPAETLTTDARTESDQRCLVLAPVGEGWMSAALPAGLAQVLSLEFLVDLPGTVMEIAAAVASRVGDRPVLVLGHSINGLLALATAALEPDAVAGVVAVGAPPQWPLDGEMVQRYWEDNAGVERKALFKRRWACFESADSDADKRAAWTHADALRRWHDIGFDPTALDGLVALDPAWTRAIFDDAAAQDWTELLGHVRCPVLLALGSSDFVVPPTAWLGNELPGASVTVRHFERSGHTPFYEEPDAFIAMLRDWNATLTAPSPSACWTPQLPASR